MFYQPVLEHAIRFSDLTSSEICVLACILIHLNQKGEGWPSIETLSRLTHSSKRTVQRNVKRLVNKQLINVRQSGCTSSTYILTEQSLKWLQNMKKI